MRKIILICTCLLLLNTIYGQQGGNNADRLKVFIDCTSTWCDMSYIRTEINLVDFMLDRIAADVHVLVTEQGTGSGGRKYQLIYFGQNNFRYVKDTISFNTDPNATDFERRDLLIKYLQLGLAPLIAKTKQGLHATISLKKAGGDKNDTTNVVKKDPWNFWVFNIGVNGNYSADENYKTSSGSINLSGRRVTDKVKLGFAGWANQNQTIFEIDNGTGGQEKITVKNHQIGADQSLIYSLGDHSSFGYQLSYSRNSFSNNRSRFTFETGVEFAVFPYKEVNTKFWTFSYRIDMRHNRYFDTTLYDQIQEFLFGHIAETKLTFNQKWGKFSLGAEYRSYLHDFSLYNVSVDMNVDIRITGGLSFYMYSYAALTRDQVFLPKGGATPQEVLTRRRQLASGYNIYTYFGLNYRFGSKLNNFVNPRFE